MITINEIKERVRHIELNTHDNEACHSAEDSLYYSVIEAIASGVDNPEELAQEALRTKHIDFGRWCG